MPLETFDRIDDLVETNPPGTDMRSQGDDHLRGLKLTVKNISPYIKLGGLAQLGFPGTYGTDNDWTGKAGYVIAVKATEDGWYHDTIENLFGPDTKKTSIAGWQPGKPSASGIILGYVFDRAVDFPISLTGSRARAIVAPADGSPSFTINKNGSGIGTIDFTIATNVASFTFAAGVSFAIGDYLTIVAPNPQDSALADIMVTLQGTRP